MASTITADTGAVSGTAGLKQSADSSGILALATGTGTTAVTIDASQNVGIGTSSPSTYGKLAVSSSGGTPIVSLPPAGGFNAFEIYNGTNAAKSIGLNDAGQGTLAFYRYNSSGSFVGETMRIDSSGNLLVGTTDSNLPSFGSYNVDGVGLTSAKYVAASGSGRSSVAFKRYTSTGQVVEIFYGTTQVGSISVTGSATSYVTTSDYRLKENVQPMTGALSVVSALKPCTYTWKADGSNGQGFIAHELAEVVPDCVQGAKDAVKEDGNPVYQGIDTSFLVATLTAAIQEQQALITTLTERIAALEAK
jgi:hypothetical protein